MMSIYLFIKAFLSKIFWNKQTKTCCFHIVQSLLHDTENIALQDMQRFKELAYQSISDDMGETRMMKFTRVSFISLEL